MTNEEKILTHAATDIGYFARQILRFDNDKFNSGASQYGDIHSGQRRWLRNSWTRYNLLHAANRFGKGESQAVKFLWLHFRYGYLGYGSDAMTCNTALTKEQAIIIFEKIISMVKNAGDFASLFFNPSKDVKYHPQPEIRFSNESILRARSYADKGKRLEGDAYRFINVDECALERHLLVLHSDIFPQRIGDYDYSQVDYTATPKGKNQFHRLKKELDKKGYYTQGGVNVTGVDLKNRTYKGIVNPFISKKYIDDAMESWSIEKIQQSLLGEFIDNANLLFASRTEQLFDESLKFSDPIKDHIYCNVWDLARGRKGDVSDATVGYSIDVTELPYKVVKVESFQLPWTEKSRQNENDNTGTHFTSSIEQKIRDRHKLFPGKTGIDSTGIGDTLYEIISDIAVGIDFRGKKVKLIEKLQTIIDKDMLKSPFIYDLYTQMVDYELSDLNLETDFIMALCLFSHFVDMPRKRKSYKKTY